VPGVVSVQAVRLSPEIGIVVVHKDNLPTRGERKPTLCNERKAAVLSYARASKEGHHRGLRTGHVRRRGSFRNLGEPTASLPLIAGRGPPADQRAPALTMRFPAVSEPSEGIQTTGKQQGAHEASDERSDPGRTSGQS